MSARINNNLVLPERIVNAVSRNGIVAVCPVAMRGCFAGRGCRDDGLVVHRNGYAKPAHGDGYARYEWSDGGFRWRGWAALFGGGG